MAEASRALNEEGGITDDRMAVDLEHQLFDLTPVPSYRSVSHSLGFPAVLEMMRST